MNSAVPLPQRPSPQGSTNSIRGSRQDQKSQTFFPFLEICLCPSLLGNVGLLIYYMNLFGNYDEKLFL